MAATVSSSQSSDMLPCVCLQYEFDWWPISTLNWIESNLEGDLLCHVRAKFLQWIPNVEGVSGSLA